MKTKPKRLLAVLLTLCLALSFVPITAFADSGAYAVKFYPGDYGTLTKNDQILFVYYGIDEDVNKPYYYKLHVSETDTFGFAGSIIDTLLPNQGYEFAYWTADATVYRVGSDTAIPAGTALSSDQILNGITVKSDVTFTAHFRQITEYPEDSVITTVEIIGATLSYNTGDAPRATAAVAAADQGKYRIAYECWEEMENGEPVAFWYSDESKYTPSMKKITQFEEGKTYMYSIELKQKDGYTFANNCSVMINGNPLAASANVVKTVDGLFAMNVKTMIPTESDNPAAIDLIEINDVTVSFKDGDKPVFTGTVPENDQYAFRCEWWSLDENTGIVSTEPEWGGDIYKNKITAFEAGKTYHYGVYVTAYTADISPDAKLKINGREVEYTRIGDESDTQSFWVETNLTMTPAADGHTHNYGTDWKYDSTNHWHECSCGDKSDLTAHSFKWVTDKEATATEKGSKHEECTVCGYKKTAATIKDDGKYTLLLSCVPSSDGKIDGDYTKMIKFDVADGDTTVSLSELTADVLPFNGKTQFAYWATDFTGETRVPEDIPLSDFNSKGTFYVERDEVEYTNGFEIYATFSEEPLKGTGTYYLTLDGVGGKVNGKYEKTLTSSSNDFQTIDLTQYVPVREGLTFVGWALNGEFVTEISADCFKESDAVKVLATYINNTFDDKFISLTLNANGGTLNGKESDKYNYIGGRDSGAEMSLLPYVPVRDGYTFNGWNTKSDGSGNNYKYLHWRIWDNSEVTNKEFDKDTLIKHDSGYEQYKNVTLYASWTKTSGEPENPGKDTVKEIQSTGDIKARIEFAKEVSKDYKLDIKPIEVKKELADKNVKFIADINVLDGNNNVVKISDTKMKVRIALPEDLKGYKKYEVVYILNDEIKETLPAAVENGYIVFETNHLGQYGIVGTNTGGGEHTHSYGSEWKYDADNHWHECSCGDKADKAAHDFKWVVDKEATATQKGSKHEECKVCGYKTEIVNKEALSAALVLAEQKEESAYTTDSWNAFKTAFDAAKEVYAKEDATQAEIESAKENLQKAMDALLSKTGWQVINDQKYYYGEDGTKKTGWQEIDGKKYYFGDENDGAMKTYWQKIDGKWYFFGNDGVMRTYWQKIWGKWYFLGNASDGAMKTGWQQVYGKWYYLGSAEDGSMKTYWQKINGKWYFFGGADDGAMKTGWQKIWGKCYYLGSANDGAMKTGWQKINGKWYYFGGEQDGSMKSNVWVGDYHLDNSGVWSKTRKRK